MSDSLKPFSSPGGSDLHEEVQQLRTLMGFTLVASLVATLSVGGYIFKQLRQLRHEVKSREESLAQLPEESRKMTAFVAQLKQFSRTYPDFAEVLKKYNLKDEEPAVSPVAPTGTPAAPPKTK